ncbi:TrmB family transcriptional regulator [Haloparvum sp. PAK95]|uniref:TrmB family transcriptional regulator n=1 Tax=Haloparvum sp. PAK95 TaxID=3418962 RepID=UPI003D2EE373
MATNEAERLLERLDLPEYERTALRELLTLGRTTAPDLAEATGIPKARIYGVLDELVDRGFVELIPERPKKYQPKPPEEILDRAIENERQSYEQSRAEIEEIRGEFLDTFGPLYETAAADVTPTEELFAVVDVGEPSETETRKLYHEADREVRVLTKSFEYFPSVEPAFAEAVDRGIDVSVLFVDPNLLSAENRPVQTDRVRMIREEYPSVGVRFSEEPLPWRGTFADPSMEYDSGTAILLVEEEDVPLHRRKAAVTENGSFVAGLSQYFDLIWDHESTRDPRQDRS